jgi:hypothetical protein
MTAAHLNLFHFYRRFFYTLVGLAVILVVVNLYMISQTVFSGVAREQAVKALADQRGEMVALETEYLNRSADLTIEKAVSMGFRDAASVTTFVHAETGAPVVAVLH